MNKNSRQRILFILLGLWTFALLIYTGWSLADSFLKTTAPTALPSQPVLATLAKQTPLSNQTKIAQTSSAGSIMLPSASPTSLAEAETSTPQGGLATAILSLTPSGSPYPAAFTPPGQGGSPTAAFTSTPLPTLPPGTPPSPTPTRYQAPTQPPSYYYGLMTQLYSSMIGQWRGMVSITVNRQSRPAQLITLEFYSGCQTGQVCGKYHWESGCFGDLVLMKWRPKTLVFRNVEYSADASCPDWVEYAVQPKPGDTLYLSMSFRDEDKRRISKGVTLRRR